jgi:predicted nucleic acid-binding protein
MGVGILALPGISILPINGRAMTALVELLRRHPVTGPDVFDLQIVATMKANGIHTIYTFNAADFQAFALVLFTAHYSFDNDLPTQA